MAHYDVAVIGSGLSGIAFSRVYLEVHPQCNLTILEEDTCVGGVWSSSRVYERFWSQSGQRMAGFSDVAFQLPPNASTYHDTFEARYITLYLEEYIDSHVYNGVSLRDRIKFGYRVGKVERLSSGWSISMLEPSGQIKQSIRASRLVVASGITSIPNMPNLPDQAIFKGLVLHHKQFGSFSHSGLNDSKVRHVVVLGAGKSSADMVYECIKKGKDVSWVIGTNGDGPGLFFPPGGGGRYRNSVEHGATRLNACFGPSSFMPDSWLLKLFHGSGYGRDYLEKKIKATDEACRRVAAYQTRADARKEFENMEPAGSAFWCTAPLGLIQHDDFWDVFAQHARIFRGEITGMTQGSVVIDKTKNVLADTILCGTGWKPIYPFLSPLDAISLGLPHDSRDDTDEEREAWKTLLEAADQRITSAFPIFKHPPTRKKPDIDTTTSRLYNGIAPLTDSSIVFLGHLHLSNSFRTAEAQAIWATAYFDGSFKLPPLHKAREAVAHMNACSRRRYPTKGSRGDYCFFELIWYTDRLMQDIGLNSHTQKGWWWDYWLEPCLASDFRDSVNEYKQKIGS